MKSLQIVVICLLAFTGLTAQSEETLFNKTNLNLSGAWGSAAYNFASFNGDDWTLIRGGYGGIEFGRDLFIGWGGYETRDKFTVNDSDPNYNFSYHGPVIGIAPNSIKMIHPRFTFITGSGKVTNSENNQSDRMLVFQPSAGFEFNVFQWFRLGFEGGYRFVGSSDKFDMTSGDLSAPFAQIEMRFGLSWGD
jgi:hypothetical protein